MVSSFGSSIRYTAGGATQNSLRVAQWILRSPNICSFTGCISDDLFGQEMRKQATADGVNVLYMITQDDLTGTCAVCITGTERSLCAYLGAANLFSKHHLDTIWSTVEKSDLFYVSGFHLTVSPDSVLKLAKHAAEEKKTFTFNLAAPFVSHFFSHQLLSVLPFVNILFGNETEAAAFAEMKKWDPSLSVKEIALKMAGEIKERKKEKEEEEKETRLVIITQGSDPVIVVKGVDGGECEVTEFPVERIDKNSIVDTNGAGDAFVGGFISQYIQKKPLQTCLKAAVFAASRIIQSSGCTFPPECDFKDD